MRFGVWVDRFATWLYYCSFWLHLADWRDHDSAGGESGSATGNQINIIQLNATESNYSREPERDDFPCPLPQILYEASLRAVELVENLQRFTATERIEHTEFGKNGKPRTSSTERFNYTAEIAQNTSGGFWVNEYRTAKGQSTSPPLADLGTVAVALIFHPKLRTNFEIQCDGKTDIQGEPVWQLQFREGPDPSKSFSALRIKNSEYPTRFKGRAWISANDYQVLRLETELVAPLPQIRLQIEHFDVAYAPVEFSNHQFRLWLPATASMQIDYRGHHYQRVHTFGHFQLFLVHTEQRVKMPVPPTTNSWINEQLDSCTVSPDSSHLTTTPNRAFTPFDSKDANLRYDVGVLARALGRACAPPVVNQHPDHHSVQERARRGVGARGGKIW